MKILIHFLAFGFGLLISFWSNAQRPSLSECSYRKEVRKDFLVRAQYVRRIQMTPIKFPNDQYTDPIQGPLLKVDFYNRTRCYFGLLKSNDQDISYVLRRNLAGKESIGKFAYDTTTFQPLSGLLRCADWDSNYVVNDSIYPVWSITSYHLKCVDTLEFVDLHKIRRAFKEYSPLKLKILVYTNADEYDKVYAYYCERIGLVKLTYRINWFRSFFLEDFRNRATLKFTKAICSVILESYPDPDWYVESENSPLDFESVPYASPFRSRDLLTDPFFHYNKSIYDRGLPNNFYGH